MDDATAESPLLAAALEYIGRGWLPIPIPYRSKAPILNDWPALRLTVATAPSYFNGQAANVGLLLGTPLVDVDLDCNEALAVAEDWLPPTDRTSGRPDGRVTHHWYLSPEPLVTERLKDPALSKTGKDTLVELRGLKADGTVGAQTLAPPSTHPDDEAPLRWYAEGEPATVPAAALRVAVRRVAACALLARYWPGEGGRHDATLALAGMLARAGWSETDAGRLVRSVCRAASDTEVTDRVRAVGDTFAALAAGKPATGLPRLAACIRHGDIVAPRVALWLGNRADDVEASEPPPLDVFGDATLAGSPPLEAAMLPEVIARFAADEAERLGVDLAMLALPCLVTAAAAIDDSHRLQPKRYDAGWTESPRLWLGIVDESGHRKTPALRKATAPLRAIERDWLKTDLRALADYEKAMQRHRAAMRRKGGTDLDEPARPTVRRLVVDDATIESLSDILADNPRGVLCVRDELSGWFASFDAYRKAAGQDRAHWLELYNGGPRPIDRVVRGRVLVPNWSACLLGGIQPGPMRRLAGKIDDDGLLQRFVVVFPAPGAAEVDRAPDYEALHAYARTLHALVRLDPAGAVYRLDDDAQAVRGVVTRVAHNVVALPDTSPAFRSHLGKWDALFARLTLVYHLVDAASNGTEPAPFASSDTAERVGRLMSDFLLPHAAKFYVDLLGSEHLTHARWIAGHILAHALERISARDVGRAYRELRGDGRRIAATMAQLEVVGWVTPIDTTRGPFPSKWAVNPQVHTRFAARAAAERRRREAVRRQVAEAVAELGLTPEDA
ncbi:DUF3987 domain-containing protein [Candidatus Binatia bacterium]|nr:DUF3987 domain-containing protein [Candidatus Binatia bacterium]